MLLCNFSLCHGCWRRCLWTGRLNQSSSCVLCSQSRSPHCSSPSPDEPCSAARARELSSVSLVWDLLQHPPPGAFSRLSSLCCLGGRQALQERFPALLWSWAAVRDSDIGAPCFPSPCRDTGCAPYMSKSRAERTTCGHPGCVLAISHPPSPGLFSPDPTAAPRWKCLQLLMVLICHGVPEGKETVCFSGPL